MKKQLFTLISAAATSLVMGQAVPNGGFENWNVNNYEVPQFYQTSSFSHVNGSIIAPNNAVKTGNSYHGSFAIQLNTVSTSGGPAFGYFSQGNPGGGSSAPQGGMPYNQQATGLRLYYKSNIMSGDTALVIVQFKKAGNLIGSYISQIYNNQIGYTLLATTFSPALTMAPDTVVFAAVSSNAFSSNGIVGSMLQIDSVSFTGVSSQPADLNGDFENWASMVNYGLPGWQLNDSTKQTTDAYTGSYALELVTGLNYNNNNQPSPGQASTGNGVPYTLTHDTLVFYYKYAPAGGSNDTAMVCVNARLAGSYVGGGCNTLTASATYKMEKIAIISSSAPDTLIVDIQSSKNYPVSANNIGSDLKIDNMYLMSSPLGIKVANNDNNIAVQPNPSNGVFNVSVKGFASVKMEKIEIFDINGNIVEARTYDVGFGKTSENFDLSSLNAGVYNISIISNGGLVNKRVIIAH